MPAPLVGVAFSAMVAALVLPFPRDVAPGTALMTQTPASAPRLIVTRSGTPGVEQDRLIRVTLTPANLAQGADWFEVEAWQGGGQRTVQMLRTGYGTYVSATSFPTGGNWKAMLYLAHGSAVEAAPIDFPADPEYRLPALRPRDGVPTPFVPASSLLMREVHGGAGWVAPLCAGSLALGALTWLAVLLLAFARVAASGGQRAPEARATDVQHAHHVPGRHDTHEVGALEDEQPPVKRIPAALQHLAEVVRGSG
jgi:hypothetical protein